LSGVLDDSAIKKIQTCNFVVKNHLV